MMDNILAVIGVLCLMPAMLISEYLLDGWALSQMWKWFIIPVWENAPALQIWQAVGISFVVGYLTNHTVHLESQEREWYEWIIIMLARPIFIVAIAGLINHFFL